MSKRDYEAIADVLNMFSGDDEAGMTAEEISVDLADALAELNPRFDRARFLLAAGVVPKLDRTCKFCSTDYHDPGGPVNSPQRCCPKCGAKAWYAGPNTPVKT